MEIERITKLEVKLPEVEKATLLTTDEYDKYHKLIKNPPSPHPGLGLLPLAWYLREETPNNDGQVPYVDNPCWDYTDPDYNDPMPEEIQDVLTDYQYGTGNRPVLVFKSSLYTAGLQNGDTFYVYGWEFSVISETLAICNNYISQEIFDKSTNDYEKSSIKRRIDEWFEEEIKYAIK